MPLSNTLLTGSTSEAAAQEAALAQGLDLLWRLQSDPGQAAVTVASSDFAAALDNLDTTLRNAQRHSAERIALSRVYACLQVLQQYPAESRAVIAQGAYGHAVAISQATLGPRWVTP